MSQDMTVAPDCITPVSGWRCWSARRCARTRKWRLTSPAYGTPWPTGAPCIATCDTAHHVAPCATCSCGIWALDAPGADLMLMARHGGAPVLGRVHGWGAVIEGDRGWRMAMAYPAELIIPDFSPLTGSDIPHPDELVRDIAAYGVPTTQMGAAELTLLLRGGPAAIGAHR